jgi:hypothetical protein
MSRAVKRRRDGRYELRIGPAERDLLRSLGPQMRELLGTDDDPAVGRLFPVAYPEERDGDRETEYRLLVRDELRESHRAALGVIEESVDAERLDEDQAMAWMRGLNSVRLVLGTRLGITEEGDERPDDEEDPRIGAFALYDFLTALQGELIEALSR